MRFIITVLILTSFLFGNSLSDRLQKLIYGKREKKVEILKYDPFSTKYEIKKTYKTNFAMKENKKIAKKRKIKLIAIMGNRAFINGKWIGINDKIAGYKVEKVLEDSVILSKKRKKMTLGFEKNREILKVREK